MGTRSRRYSYPHFLDEQSIRLLKISSHADFKSGSPNVNLEPNAEGSGSCHLALQVVQVPIGIAPSYRALSYTWGPPQAARVAYNPSDGVTLILDNEEHEVAPNLYDALAQICESYPDSYLWVDALCINQDDLTERQIHVAIMDKIYYSADEVIVWLGRALEHTDQVFELVAQIDKPNESLIDSFWYELDPSTLANFNLPGLSAEVWQWYLDFYERRYFNRGWVIQEVALAKKATAHWGASTIPWPLLVSGARIFVPDRLRKTLFAPLRGAGAETDSLAIGRNAYRIGLMQESCLQSKSGSQLVVEFCTRSRGFDSAEHILLHLMRMARDFQWTDPRDQVYSLIGLVNHTARLRGLEPLDIVPDYGETSTAAMVLTAAATALIKRCRYLGIISQVSDPSFRRIDGLPSWVPDFYRSPNFAMEHHPRFNAGPVFSEAGPKFTFQENSLIVQGVRIGVVREAYELEHYNRLEGILGMLAIAHRTFEPPGEDRTDVLWRTMMWDVYGHAKVKDEHPAPAFLADHFVSWVQSIVTKEAEDPSASLEKPRRLASQITWPFEARVKMTSSSTTSKVRNVLRGAQLEESSKTPDELASTGHFDPGTWVSSARGVVWSQGLFCTDDGHLGMGPRSGRAGDEVWIIPGCPFPMVLRRKVHGAFFVLGRAYVHGVMHGEAVSAESRWEDIVLGDGGKGMLMMDSRATLF